MEVRLGIRIREGGVHVYGGGRQALLEKIEELGSIRQAALDMGMSYRAAWGKIKATEAGLGFKLLERRVGGAKGGGATLTGEARQLMRAYLIFREGLDELVNERWQKSLNKAGRL
ncbi:MAG: LysR family transcriptional regulator [Actinomycetota bacterium]|nr:LysR family transcriptional regulator [Actinomycetota bacterium]